MAHSVIRLLLIWTIGCYWNAAAQYGFSIPYPDVDDFDSYNTIEQGTVFNFVWLVNDTYQPTIDGEPLLDSNGDISLWLTSFTDTSYTHCLAASVYSGNGGSWAYAVDLSDDEIDANGGKFVYRLKPTVSSQDAPYDNTEREVPSRGFLIEKASDVAAASSSSAAAAASASSASIAAVAAASRSAASQSEAAAQSASQAAENSAIAQASSASESAALAASASSAAEASKSAAEASSASQAAQTTTPPDQSSAAPTSAQETNTPSITSAGSSKTSKAATGTTPKASSQDKSAQSSDTTATGTAAQATSTGTGTPTPSASSSGGLSTGAKAGIAIGAIALALLAAIALILFLRHRKRTAAAAQPPGPPQPVPVMAQDKHYAEHNRHSAPQFMGQQSPQPGYAVPPPPQAYGGGRPEGGPAEMGGNGGYGAQELPNPHAYGYGAELPAYERPR
ncbi:hypothetical protein BU16DRAFT_599844 [Lophium mytilinum]|uniref:Mid2 domain-containing protein n=1 Tax=Lophium mytilinum TaxID=390894 RepID=A0A6A6RBD7_9PEZI|nr:hypothetical protein BU16DRAFT_599844 [Lophium mytilinum]